MIQKLTPEAEEARRLLKEAKYILGDMSGGDVKYRELRAMMTFVFEALDKLITSGNFAEQPPTEGGKKI